MKSSIRNFNIVLKKTDLDSQHIQIDKIKNIIIEVLEDYKPPIINQFLDTLVFIISDFSMSITFLKETILISDNSTNEVAHQLDKFIKLVGYIEKECSGNLFAYGYNYNLEVTLENKTTEVLQDLLNKKILEEKKLIGKKMITSQVQIKSDYNDYLTVLTLTPNLTKENADTSNMSVSCNYHFEKNPLPVFDVLKNDYLDRYNELNNLLNNLDKKDE